jgi:hypothetical protein
MSLQYIIDNCDAISINRRKIVGVQVARNQLVRTNETPTVVPWAITIKPNVVPFNEARALIEELDRLDRNKPEIITLGNHVDMRWLYKYQGQMTALEQSSLRVSSFVGNQLVLTATAVTGPSKIMFAKGDLLQIVGFPHPFTVVSNVLRGSGDTVTVTTHRPNVLLQAIPANTAIIIGPLCQFRVICTNMPVYTLATGAYSKRDGVVQNNAILEFSDDFSLYEYIV